MARSYRHVSEYEEEILRLKAERKTKREIGELLGFTKDAERLDQGGIG